MVAQRYRWWVVAMLWLVCLFNYADRQAIFSVYPLLRDELGINKAQFGIIGSSFMWLYAAALPLAGIIADRFNRKALILGGLVFWSFVTLATGWAQGYGQLVLCRALEGLGEAFYFPASIALISDYHGPATRSRAMGWHQSSVYAGTILGGGVAGYCGDHYGWRIGFTLFGSLGAALAVVLLFTLREPTRGAADAETVDAPPPSGGAFASIAEVLSNRLVLLLIAVFIGSNFVAIVFLTWLPTYLHDNFGMSLTRSGWTATTWREVASMVGSVAGGWLADRWARQFRGGRMRVQAIALFAGAPFIFLTGWTRNEDVMAVAQVGFGFFKGVYGANIWASLFETVRPAQRGTAQGLMNALGWLGAATGPVVIAVASDRFGMGACLSATALIYVLFGILMLVGSLKLAPRPVAPAKEIAP